MQTINNFYLARSLNNLDWIFLEHEIEMYLKELLKIDVKSARQNASERTGNVKFKGHIKRIFICTQYVALLNELSV